MEREGRGIDSGVLQTFLSKTEIDGLYTSAFFQLGKIMLL